MTVDHVEVRGGAYHDSVSLMQVSRAVAAVPGVLAAQVAMGTDLNVDVLRGLGFAVPDGAGPADLLVALRADDDAAVAAALAAVEAGLVAPTATSTGATDVPPQTTGSAVRASGAGLVLVSVPGRHAFTEAMDALAAGAHVMVFSDNVPVAQEVRLKEEAARRGLLVMGPDCGTAVVSGVGLGFANVVAPGPVGIVAASGTGAQQVMCLLDAAGVGVRHCLGVGGRDVSEAVGGVSTLAALALLDADPAVEQVVVVGKPPAPQVASAVEAAAARMATPVHLALLGPGRPDLTAASAAVAQAVGASWQEPRWWPAPQERTGAYGVLRGAFCGGTLRDEAAVVLGDALGPLGRGLDDDGHLLVDFGDDDLTRGRAHPMIDGSLRADWLVRRAVDPAGVVLLVDVVLGHGAHPDPAAELVPALRAAHDAAARAGTGLAVVVSLCGTAGDPQGLERQAQALVAAGASVHRSNAHAARKAAELLEA